MGTLPLRIAGRGITGVIGNAASRAGRRSRPLDPEVLERVRDALLRLPDDARGPHYYAIPGERLAQPRGEGQP
jgi:hypothetical protein